MAFELPGDEAIMHRDGERLVIEPVRKRGLVALLKSMEPLDETFPEIEDPVPELENPHGKDAKAVGSVRLA